MQLSWHISFYNMTAVITEADISQIQPAQTPLSKQRQEEVGVLQGNCKKKKNVHYEEQLVMSLDVTFDMIGSCATKTILHAQTNSSSFQPPPDEVYTLTPAPVCVPGNSASVQSDEVIVMLWSRVCVLQISVFWAHKLCLSHRLWVTGSGGRIHS